MGACFHLCSQLYLALDADCNRPFLGSIFLKSRLLSKFLEPLISLLAYLEPKLWPKNRKLVKFLLPQMLTRGVFHPRP